jgi:peroxin-5
MSFLGGAECSTAGNPLSQFTKHVQDDKSLQRDRLVGRGPDGLQGMRSTGMNGSQDNVSFCKVMQVYGMVHRANSSVDDE